MSLRGVLLIMGVVAIGLSAGVSAVADTPPVEAGKNAAMAWIEILDAGDPGGAWDAAAAGFREDVTRERWIEMMDPVRTGLGAPKERKLASERFTRSIPGAPDGEYVVVEYDTSFESKGAVIEKITVVKEPDGQWRVSAYIFGY